MILLIHWKEMVQVDDLTLHLSELDMQNEELEKQVGRLSAQVQMQAETLKKLTDHIQNLAISQEEMKTEQAAQKKRLHSLRRHIESLNTRMQTAEDTSAQYAAELNTLTETVRVLSGDMDTLYSDMNALVTETRNRGAQMKAKMEQFFWDAAEQKYQDEQDTMW